MTSSPVESPVTVGDLIPCSRLNALLGDLDASDPAVCEGDDVYDVYATTLVGGRRRGLLFAAAATAAEQDESWMSPDTELAFLRCIAASDASFVENFIACAEKNYWYGEKSVFLTLDMGKTISNRQIKLVLHNSELQKTLNHRNTPKPLKKTDYTLAKWPYISQNQLLKSNGDDSELAPWIRQSRNKRNNVHLLCSNQMPVALDTPVDRRADQHRQPQPPQQGVVFFQPPPPGQMLVYRFPVPMIHYQPPSFACRPWPMGSFFQRLPTPFPPPPPTYFHWGPRVNAEPVPSTVTVEQYPDRVKYLPKYNRQAQTDIDAFVKDKYIIEKIISTFETKDENALRSFMYLLKRVYPKKLEEFNKMMTIMDYLNSVSI